MQCKMSLAVRAFFMLVALSVLSGGCTTNIKAEVSQLELLRDYTTISGTDESIRVKGWVRGVVTTDREILSFIEDRGHVQSSRIALCKSDLDIGSWTKLYQVPNSAENEYYFVFQYKSWPQDQWQYNLIDDPEELCFQVAAAEMNPFVSIISEKIPFSLPDELMQEIERYDRDDGVISLVDVLSNGEDNEAN